MNMTGAHEWLLQAGMSPAEAHVKAERLGRLLGALESQRRTPAPSVSAWFVPGRIEVLGKHTDYAGGRSLICAAEKGLCVLSSPRTDRSVTITDTRRGSTMAATLEGGVLAPEERWFSYPRTVIRRLARNFPDATHGCDIAFDSDLPSASGMSSSSALMIAAFLALADANDLAATDTWQQTLKEPAQLAAYLATVENGQSFGPLVGDSGVGTAGGSEDHTAILCSQAGYLGQFAFCPVRRERTILLDESLTFAIAVSGIAARKTAEAREPYNMASRSAAAVLGIWREHTGRDDISLGAAIVSAPDAADRLREAIASGRYATGSGSFSTQDLLDRLEHFVEESERIVGPAADCLARGDLAGFGELVSRSQQFAERLLRNQVPETVFLQRAAIDNGAQAASAFGAGFGGSVWALVTVDDAAAFVDRWRTAYDGRGTFLVTRPGMGVVNGKW